MFVVGTGPLRYLLMFAAAAHAATWNAKTSWGATGNGTSNDGPAIQAGVAKIAAGDTVYFPSGTYLIRNAVTFSVGAVITCQAGAVLQGPNIGTDVLEHCLEYHGRRLGHDRLHVLRRRDRRQRHRRRRRPDVKPGGLKPDL